MEHELYEAARLVFMKLNNNAKCATALIKLGRF